MKGLFDFAMICLYALGSIGGVGMLLKSGDWLFAIGVSVVAYMAFPKAKEYYKEGLECKKGL